MFMLAERHRELLQKEKLAFCSPFLTSGIQEVWKRFKGIKRKDRFQWDKNLTDLVLKPGAKWMEDVVTIYTPMIWDDKHWVGLAINLDLGCVEILDRSMCVCMFVFVCCFRNGEAIQKCGWFI